MVKKLVLLGSTGSVGRQVLQVVDEFPEQYAVIGMAAGANLDLLAAQISKYHPQYVSISSAHDAARLKELISGQGGKLPEILSGKDGLVQLAELTEMDLLLVAVSGINGLSPTLTA